MISRRCPKSLRKKSLCSIFVPYLLLQKSSEACSTKTPPQIPPSNFTTRFWVEVGPRSGPPGVPSDGFAALRCLSIRETRGPNAFKTRLKCTCHETALSVTRQTCTWNCPGPSECRDQESVSSKRCFRKRRRQ